jgi:hypothetical protein
MALMRMMASENSVDFHSEESNCCSFVAAADRDPMALLMLIARLAFLMKLMMEYDEY